MAHTDTLDGVYRLPADGNEPADGRDQPAPEPVKCVVVASNRVAVRREPNNSSRVIGSLRPGKEVDMLWFHEGYGCHWFMDRQGEHLFGWSAMWGRGGIDLIQPCAPPTMKPPPLPAGAQHHTLAAPAAHRAAAAPTPEGGSAAAAVAAAAAQQQQQQPMAPGRSEGWQHAPLRTCEIGADDALRNVGLEVADILEGEIDEASPLRNSWLNRHIEDGEHVRCVVVTKPFLPIRAQRTGLSELLGVLGTGTEIDVLAINHDDNSPWGLHKWVDRKGTATFAWSNLWNDQYGDLARPLDGQGALNMQDVILQEKSERNLRMRTALAREARQEARRAALRQMPFRVIDHVRAARRHEEDVQELMLLLPLGDTGTTRRRGPRRPFRHIAIMGAHHTCTNALGREIKRFFDVDILNGEYGDGWDGREEVHLPLWKHRVRTSPLPVPEETLAVCLVKDPAFWLQSLGRKPPTSFYHVHPLEETTEGLMDVDAGRGDNDVPRASRDDLLRTSEFDGVIYRDSLEVWEASVCSYFDAAVYPPESTSVLRCEDFLFRFGEVIDALAQRGLQPRAAQPTEPVGRPAKAHGFRARSREEALQFYAEDENRFAGLSPEALEKLEILLHCNPLVAMLNYHTGCSSWAADPQR